MDDKQKIITDGEAIRETIKSNGWGLIRRKLTDKIMDLQSVMNIEAKTPEEAVNDIRARKSSIEILVSWLKDVEGDLEQYEDNKNLLLDEEYDIIRRT